MRIHRWILCAAAWGISGLSFSLSAAQPGEAAGPTRKPRSDLVKQLQCLDCHISPTPTKQTPGLAPCPRLSPEKGPEVVLLDQLSNQYVPVVFAHKLHAQMTDMSGGCVLCHHHNPGNGILRCRDCHGSSSTPENLQQPGLKGAYHRQCLNCHREWSHQTDCVVCHAKKTADFAPIKVPDATDIMGMLHPNIEEPLIKTFQTKYEKGALVTFRHQDHVQRFGFKCVNCHREEGCSRCHSPEGRVPQPKTFEQHHRPCASCHELATTEDGRCSHCHSDRETPPFNHASTGMPLSRYHENRTCRSCHPVNEGFAKLNRECVSCHDRWSPKTFNHAVTGLVLDKDHQAVECADCHLERKFDRSPSCAECHEDKDNIKFPEKIPGTRLP